MKYYIIKSSRIDIDNQIIEGIKFADKNAVFVDEVSDCDIAVLQHGWLHSKSAVQKSLFANKPCRDGSFYSDLYRVRVTDKRP